MAEASRPQNQLTAPVQSRFRRCFRISGVSEGVVKWFCFVCALVSVATTIGIITVLVSQSIPFFREVNPAACFAGTVWSPTPEEGGWIHLSKERDRLADKD